MRTIKFRGYGIVEQKWFYGNLVEGNAGHYITFADYDEVDGDMIRYYPIETKTIGQFTGLLDKNGREIYEGDYVEVQQSGFGGVITWHTHGYFYIKELYKFKYNEESDCISLGEFIDNPKRKVAIVGNIHDNPELIKGE